MHVLAAWILFSEWGIPQQLYTALRNYKFLHLNSKVNTEQLFKNSTTPEKPLYYNYTCMFVCSAVIHWGNQLNQLKSKA